MAWRTETTETTAAATPRNATAPTNTINATNATNATNAINTIKCQRTCQHTKQHRVLIYSQFTRTLDLLEDWLALRRWGYQRIDG